MDIQIIDTHIHIWDLEKARYTWLDQDTSILNKTYTVEEFDSVREEVGVSKGILVQAANHIEDTDLMLQAAVKTKWITGVVGWLPLLQPEETEKLLAGKYFRHQYFKGVRHLIHNEADTAWLLQEKVIESLKLLVQYNLPYDVVGVIPAHIETAIKVAEKVPGLKMVFDHLNQPPIATKKFGQWGDLMKEAASHQNFHAKISGLGTASGNFEGWTNHDLKPYIEFVLENFGENRCFCGGDWPVSLLAGGYAKTWNSYQIILSSLLNNSAKPKVFSENAERFYGLKV